MSKKYFGVLLLLFCASLSFASWQDREIKRINKKISKIGKMALVSKKIDFSGVTVILYYNKGGALLRGVESQSTVQNTVVNHYYFDKKSGDLLAVNQGSTYFYYQHSGYFAVLSSQNLTKDQAVEAAKRYYNFAQQLKKKR
jgi:hypothetical protein